jgi:hypothetical protein
LEPSDGLLVLGRQLSATCSLLAMHFYTGLGGSVSLAVVLAIGFLSGLTEFRMPALDGTSVWALLLVMSVLASIVHLMYI